MMSIPEITVKELKKMIDNQEDFFLLDVRNPDEYEVANINGNLIPLGELPRRTDEVPDDKKVVCLCHHGRRSMSACEILQAKGKQVINVEGGIHQWSLQIDPKVATY